jgi:hypothetical protein
MSDNKHIARIKDTWANVLANLDDGQTALVTDQNNEHVHRIGSNYYFPAMSKYWNGSAFVYLDTSHDDITAYGDVSVAGILTLPDDQYIGLGGTSVAPTLTLTAQGSDDSSSIVAKEALSITTTAGAITVTATCGQLNLLTDGDANDIVITSNEDILLDANEGITMTADDDIVLNVGDDGTGSAKINLADNAGVSKLSVYDSDAAEVFSVDSNGNVDAADFASTSFADITSSCTITGWAEVLAIVLAKKIGKTAFVQWMIVGNSNATTCSIELPAAFLQAAVGSWGLYALAFVVDNSTAAVGRAVVNSNSLVITFYPSLSGTSWTATGAKSVYGEIFFECAS